MPKANATESHGAKFISRICIATKIKGNIVTMHAKIGVRKLITIAIVIMDLDSLSTAVLSKSVSIAFSNLEIFSSRSRLSAS